MVALFVRSVEQGLELLGIFPFGKTIMLFVAEVLLFARRLKLLAGSGRLVILVSWTRDQWILHLILLVQPDGRRERRVVWRRDHFVGEAIQ